MTDSKEKFHPPSYHDMSKTVDELPEDKPQKVVPLDPEKSIPVLHPPKLGDPDRAIREIEKDVENNPVPKTDPELNPNGGPLHEVPPEHDIPLEEAAKKLEEK